MTVSVRSILTSKIVEPSGAILLKKKNSVNLEEAFPREKRVIPER